MGGGEKVEETISLLFTSVKNTKVANLWEERESGSHWSLQFKRLLQDWEIEVVTQFFWEPTFLVRKQLWKKILTINILMKKRWKMVNRCSCYNDSEESCSYLDILW